MALTRRLRSRGGREPLRFPPYVIDTDQCRISWSGNAAELTPKAFDLACFLFQNQGKLLSRGHLLDRVWGQGADVDTRTVDAHVTGSGYCLEAVEYFPIQV